MREIIQGLNHKNAEMKPLELENWLPYRISVIANCVSDALEAFYSTRFGLGVVSWRVMAALGRYSPMSAKETAEKIAMDQVSVSRAISELANLGFISRRVDQADRRRVVLRLNKKGLAAYFTVVPLAIEVEKKLISGLNEEEKNQLEIISSKLLIAAKSLGV